MKCKQSVDTAVADALDHAIADFAKMYTKEWIALLGVVFDEY
jgi:hypothetical protein